jgi:hypothetical protein
LSPRKITEPTLNTLEKKSLILAATASNDQEGQGTSENETTKNGSPSNQPSSPSCSHATSHKASIHTEKTLISPATTSQKKIIIISDVRVNT